MSWDYILFGYQILYAGSNLLIKQLSEKGHL